MNSQKKIKIVVPKSAIITKNTVIIELESPPRGSIFFTYLKNSNTMNSHNPI
ncbi:hypothetical protein MDPP_00193 [Candidatus Phytoplasma pini]|uniref:Uncharacterized protein n=1 Tax=Candidatus Phytoplasma pini TaxID=267362 RepID=A0A559KJJ9_9MOLU|nr:hypothetical protein MDPP_00193 [Candidatus Phytoplasma pini]